MRIEHAELQNFRNIQALALEPCEEVNIVCGDNAQGKTNFIEALWLLTGAKSFRGARDNELIRFGEERAAIEAAFFKEGRAQTARILLGQKKQAELNEIALPSVTGLAGIFCAVVFSPAHLGLIQGGPGARRRFVDTCICQLSPRYISLLGDYNRVLMQRGSLLRDISYSSFLLDTLDIWDEKLAALAAIIVQQRAHYAARMAEHAGQIYSGISAEREHLSMRYAVTGYEGGEVPEREWFMQALRQNRAEDIRMRATTIGPHRDDLVLEIEDKSVRSFGSQGQQRSAVLAMKLAESRLIKELLQDEPVILLDDVMSELDQSRQDYLLNHLKGNQVFITCCDESCCAPLRGGKTFFMENGILLERRAAKTG